MDPKDELALQSMHLPVDGVWMPTANSTLAPAVDDPFWIIYWACVISFVLIIAPMFWFAWQYRQKTPDQKAVSQIDHSQLLEISWSVAPLIFFFWVFVLGFRGFLEMFVAPQGATEVKVVGQKWAWSVAYDHRGDTVVVGGVGAEFKFVKGKPYKLIMTSQDVLHSFFVPNFRIKSDVIPGRYTTVWFEATDAGTYPVFCTEYCGTDHSNMLAKITITETEEEFLEWLDKQSVTEATPEAGQALYTGRGCNACHSVDGSRLVGPSFKGLWGRQNKFADGSSATVDAAYITESILMPNAKIVESYPAAMPSFQGQLKQDQIDAIIAYIKTLE